MSNHNSPDRIEDNRSWQSVGGNNFNSTQHQDIEEVILIKNILINEAYSNIFSNKDNKTLFYKFL